MDAFKLMKELKVNHEQEVHYLPKETGLHLIESTVSVSTTGNSHWVLQEHVKRLLGIWICLLMLTPMLM